MQKFMENILKFTENYAKIWIYGCFNVKDFNWDFKDLMHIIPMLMLATSIIW